jgi:LemA protein
MTTSLLTLLIIIAAVVFFPLVYFIATYNRLVRLRTTVKESWADVTTELKRRYDLIPNLVNTVKGYATHEHEIMDSVTKAREAALTLSQSPAAQAQSENQLSQALKSLIAIAENYPDLKASQNFLGLQEQLANTEDRIQASRRFYNANVRDINVAVQSFPSSIVAGMCGFRQEEFFQADEAETAAPVTVSFN